jgi:hypothetical protein
VERQGVRYSNVRDAVAICESLRVFEGKVREVVLMEELSQSLMSFEAC